MRNFWQVSFGRIRDRTKKEFAIMEEWIDQVREALAAVEGMSIPEDHRHVIRRCLAHELHEATDRFEEVMGRANDGKPWTEEEFKFIADTVKTNKDAKSYSEIANVVEEISANLLRGEKSLRKKMVQLGYARFLDGWRKDY